MRVLYPVWQVTELAAGYRDTTSYSRRSKPLQSLEAASLTVWGSAPLNRVPPAPHRAGDAPPRSGDGAGHVAPRRRLSSAVRLGGAADVCQAHVALAHRCVFWQCASRHLAVTPVRWRSRLRWGDGERPERPYAPVLRSILREHLCGQPDVYHDSGGPASALRTVWYSRNREDDDRPRDRPLPRLWLRRDAGQSRGADGHRRPQWHGPGRPRPHGHRSTAAGTAPCATPFALGDRPLPPPAPHAGPPPLKRWVCPLARGRAKRQEPLHAKE